jgi:hypothetical protein
MTKWVADTHKMSEGSPVGEEKTGGSIGGFEVHADDGAIYEISGDDDVIPVSAPKPLTQIVLDPVGAAGSQKFVSAKQVCSTSPTHHI